MSCPGHSHLGVEKAEHTLLVVGQQGEVPEAGLKTELGFDSVEFVEYSDCSDSDPG